MRRLAVLTCVTSLVACGPGGAPSDGCHAPLVAGDLVITEVFADGKSSDGGTGSDAGKEWFEIYNARGAPIDLTGLTITHSRPDGSKPNIHVMAPAMIAPGQYFTLGDATLPPAYLDYSYGSDLGELFNSDGGKLALTCGDREIDSAPYDAVVAGHARELGAGPPDYQRNDDPASWCEATASAFVPDNFGTPGAASDCMTLAVGQCTENGALRAAVLPGPGDLVITEVMASPSRTSDTTGEWLEAQAQRDVDLNGLAIDRAGDTAQPDVIHAAECLHAAAGSYVVFARSRDRASNGGLPAIAATFQLSLVAGTTAAPGDVAILAGDTVIDAVRWTRSAAGKSLQLDPGHVDATSNDAEGNFCDATIAYGLGDLGTPGAANTACLTLPARGTCDDAGSARPIVAPSAGQLVISEIMADPAVITDQNGEWFEVTNTGGAPFDLNELLVGKADEPGSRVQATRCLTVASHGYALFARSALPAVNGMLPPVAATFSFSLVQTSGSIQIADDAQVLDVVRWATAKPGVSAQLDPAHFTTSDNDLAASYCAGTAGYGTGDNHGTPGAANARCP